MYADDIVLLSENEIDMQDMIKCCNQWFNEWHLEVNTDKSGVVHIRPPSIPVTKFQFTCGQSSFKTFDKYKYLC